MICSWGRIREATLELKHEQQQARDIARDVQRKPPAPEVARATVEAIDPTTVQKRKFRQERPGIVDARFDSALLLKRLGSCADMVKRHA